MKLRSILLATTMMWAAGLVNTASAAVCDSQLIQARASDQSVDAGRVDPKSKAIAGEKLARRGRGADDPADHDAGDDHGNHGADHTWNKSGDQQYARHGADDAPGDDHGQHGGGHAWNKSGDQQYARHGADDAPGDDHGQHGGGHAWNQSGQELIILARGGNSGRAAGGRGRGGADDPAGHR